MPRQQLLKQFRNFHDASTSILNMMSQFIHVNTLFIAKNDQNTNQIVKVLNHDERLLEEGEENPYEKTFCKLAVDHRDTLLIPDIRLDERSKNLDVTKQPQGGSFIGVPIDFTDGTNYGTICGLDLRPQRIYRRACSYV